MAPTAALPMMPEQAPGPALSAGEIAALSDEVRALAAERNATIDILVEHHPCDHGSEHALEIEQE